MTPPPISVKIPSAGVPLALTEFTCSDGMSQLFRLVLEIGVGRGDAASTTPPLAFDAVLGQSATVSLTLPDGSPRFFNGIVSSIAQGTGTVNKAGVESTVPYQLEVVPKLWLLAHNARSRIFQQMTVKDILTKVLTGLDVRLELNATYEPRDYCAQYRETDFAFASRLMEEEGIFYFFEHADGKHTLVVGDTPGSNKPLPGVSSIRYEPVVGGVRTDDRIQEWEKRQQVTSGKVTLWDHSFELPGKNLEAEEQVVSSIVAGTVTHKVRFAANDKLELYDFPGGYAKRFSGTAPGGGDRASDVQKNYTDNTRTAKIRARQVDSGALEINGVSNCRQLVSGFKFTLTHHPDANGEYLLTAVEHSARPAPPPPAGTKVAAADGAPEIVYENRFTCVPSSVAYRPARTTPRPFVHGCQTATVVGPSGEEIFTDKYGRVKVQFHWDREGKKDANSSCWMRVATIWAGQQWGAIHIPRIGQEVVVDFLEGDPDQPIIVGSVYNAEQMPPYALPANKTQSGIKSRSTLQGGPANYNEIRFEDKKGSEQIVVHAEKDFIGEVENDETHWVGHDRTKTIDHDETTHVKHDRTETVDNDETITIHANRTETVDKDETITIHGARTETVDKDESLTVSGAQTVTITKDQTVTIIGARTESVSKDETVSISGARSVTVSKDDAFSIGKTFKLEAADEIQLVSGQATLTMKKDGTIELKGLKLTVQGQATVDVKAPQVNLKGDAMVQVKAPMAQVNGDGMLTLKGGVTMIN